MESLKEKLLSEIEEKIEEAKSSLERFFSLGWIGGGYYIWDNKKGIAYCFTYEPCLEEVQKVADMEELPPNISIYDRISLEEAIEEEVFLRSKGE